MLTVVHDLHIKGYIVDLQSIIVFPAHTHTHTIDLKIEKDNLTARSFESYL
jgi:hypothetical protein